MHVALNSLSRRIAECLLAETGPVQVRYLAGKVGCSARMIRYQMGYVSEWLKEHGAEVSRGNPHGIWLDVEPTLRHQLLLQSREIDGYQSKYSSDERQSILLRLLLSDQRDHPMRELMEQLGVTRITVLRDIEDLRRMLSRYELTVVVTRGRGYRVQGLESNVRQAIADSILRSHHEIGILTSIDTVCCDIRPEKRQPLVPEMLYTLTSGQTRQILSGMHLVVECGCDSLIPALTDTARASMALHLAIMVARLNAGHPVQMPSLKMASLKHLPEFQTARRLVERLQEQTSLEIPPSEVAYIALHLQGARRVMSLEAEPDSAMRVLAEGIARRAEEALDSQLADRELLDGLAIHLAAAYSRLKHNMPIRNPLLAEMRIAYARVFAAASHAAKAFEAETRMRLPDEEVAYIAMHIGAALERRMHRAPQRKRVALVAGCGIGTTYMLLAQIESHFPQAEIAGLYSLTDILRSPPVDIDAVISTIPLTLENVPCTVVSPVVSQRDLRAIEDLLDLIPSVSREDGPLSKSSPLPLLKLRPSAIKLGVNAPDWRQAVRAAGQLLFKHGYCQKRYIEAMVRQIDTYGSYVVLQGGLAIPHAGPADGVIKPGMSLVRLSRPVTFPGAESLEVHTVIALALPERIEPRALGFLRDLVFRGGAERLAAVQDLAGLVRALGDAVSS